MWYESLIYFLNSCETLTFIHKSKLYGLRSSKSMLSDDIVILDTFREILDYRMLLLLQKRDDSQITNPKEIFCFNAQYWDERFLKPLKLTFTYFYSMQYHLLVVSYQLALWNLSCHTFEHPWGMEGCYISSI